MVWILCNNLNHLQLLINPPWMVKVRFVDRTKHHEWRTSTGGDKKGGSARRGKNSAHTEILMDGRCEEASTGGISDILTTRLDTYLIYIPAGAFFQELSDGSPI